MASATLVEQERLAAIDEFAAIIVHETPHPLTTMLMGLKYLKKTFKRQFTELAVG